VSELRKGGRKLLIASIGVAAVSYVACLEESSSGNLMAPDFTEGGAGTGVTSGGGGASNTDGASGTGGTSDVDGSSTGGSGGIQDAAITFPDNILVANLIAPPPPDAQESN
jgi:hypothetical protein